MTSPAGRDLATIAADDPEAIIGYLATLSDDDRLSPDDFLRVARLFAADGVNIIRLLMAHPEPTRRRLGIDPADLGPHLDAFEPGGSETE